MTDLNNSHIKEFLEKNLNKNCIIYTHKGFRFEAEIKRVYDNFLEFFDTKKGFTKILDISQILEVDFL